MTQFRRCGLAEDDEIGTSSVTLRYRHDHPTSTYCSGSATIVSDDDEMALEEEGQKTVSITTSDAESVCSETSSQCTPLNLRERFLLQHRLPQPGRILSMVWSEHERRVLLSSTHEMEERCCDEGTNTDDSLRHRPERQPWQMVHPAKVFLDSQEMSVGVGFRSDCDVWFDREGIPLSQVVETDESSHSSSC